MGDIRLVEVDSDNFDEVCALSETLSLEQRKSVASNIESLAQAYLSRDTAWPRAVYAGATLVGFVMLDTEDDDSDDDDYEGPLWELWRFMIAGPHQGKGYGRQVLDLLCAKARAAGIKYLFTSCVLGEVSPYNFYIKYGFVDTGKMDDDEQILKLVL